ncbi:MAG: Asp-tRNA(Asn)/Glu-tRNA(Gln) amidotransferase subunit GatC [Polyangiaceae bacterium]
MSDSPLSRATVEHVAMLARLRLDEAEIEKMTEELGKILAYMHVLDSLDVSEVPPTAQVMIERLPLRQDAPTAEADRVTHDEALREAARHTEEGFVVPAFVDE